MKFKKQNLALFVASLSWPCCDVVFSNKTNSHTCEVEIHTEQNLYHFGCYVAKAKLFYQLTAELKQLSPRLPGLECLLGEKSMTSVTGLACLLICIMNTSKF